MFIFARSARSRSRAAKETTGALSTRGDAPVDRPINQSGGPGSVDCDWGPIEAGSILPESELKAARVPRSPEKAGLIAFELGFGGLGHRAPRPPRGGAGAVRRGAGSRDRGMSESNRGVRSSIVIVWCWRCSFFFRLMLGGGGSRMRRQGIYDRANAEPAPQKQKHANHNVRDSTDR